MKIRDATPADLPALCELCAQLGYPGTPESIGANLRGILGRPERALLVAEDGQVIGFADVSICRRLVHAPIAELDSLSVLDTARNRGIGRALLAAAEAWARAQGLRGVALSSRVTRHDAHRFYEREGYTRIKDAGMFEKVWNEP